jgi:hypothetical protein
LKSLVDFLSLTVKSHLSNLGYVVLSLVHTSDFSEHSGFAFSTVC